VVSAFDAPLYPSLFFGIREKYPCWTIREADGATIGRAWTEVAKHFIRPPTPKDADFIWVNIGTEQRHGATGT
jgi:hypothetical protein